MVQKLKALPKELGRAKRLPADNGYLSEKNVETCADAGIEPLIALKRERHNQSWRARFASEAKPTSTSATAMQKMQYRLKTSAGKKLDALRKQTLEPVFGIIKSTMGFRQFLLQGLQNVRGEWSLVTMSALRRNGPRVSQNYGPPSPASDDAAHFAAALLKLSSAVELCIYVRASAVARVRAGCAARRGLSRWR
jgi:Transposase DDE domain